jgi:hypothetical protein
MPTTRPAVISAISAKNSGRSGRLAEARRHRVACAIGLSLDRPRRDAVDGDAVVRDLAGQRDFNPIIEPLPTPARSVVERRAGAPGLPADIDDAAVLTLDHVRQHGLAAAQRVPHLKRLRLTRIGPKPSRRGPKIIRSGTPEKRLSTTPYGLTRRFYLKFTDNFSNTLELIP